MIRAAIALEIGRLKAVDVVPMAEDARSVLLVLTGEAGRVTHEVHADDLWPIAMACRNAVQKAKAVTV